MIRLKHLFLFVFVASLINSVTSQTTTVVANLHDTLQPKIVLLDAVVKPKTVVAGTPTFTQLPLSISLADTTKTIVHPEAQGKGLFTTYTSDDGLALDGISFGQGTVFVDSEGNIWFATRGGGVSKYDGQSFTTFTTSQGLANNNVKSIAQDKSGNLWFGTNGGGVSKYDGQSFTTFTTSQGLANNTVFSIAQDKSGNLWFGTEHGLNVVLYGLGVVSNSTDVINMRNVTKHLKNLPDMVIGAIRFDDKGRMIIGTNFGLYVLAEEQVKELIQVVEGSGIAAQEKFEIEGTTYNQFNGYPIKDVNYGQNNGTMHIDSQGLLWVGHGSNGVTRVDLDAVNKSKAPPTVLINKVSLKGDDVCFYSLKSGASLRGDSTTLAQQEIATYGKTLTQAERDTLQQRFSGIKFDGITKWYPLPENLVLPYEHNALTFEFNAIETGRNFMVNYQYALVENFSKGSNFEKVDWQPITKKNEATYNHLWEGEYTFLLKAQSPWGVWTGQTH